MKTAAVVCLASTLCACSGTAQRAERLSAERYRDYAEEVVEDFSYHGRLDGWRAIDRDELVVWTALNQAYLLTVAGTCPDLPSANRIGISSKTGRVSRGFDAVLLPRGQRCTILEIRRIDYDRMKQEEAELRGNGVL